MLIPKNIFLFKTKTNSFNCLKKILLLLSFFLNLTACPLNHMKVLRTETCPSVVELNEKTNIQLKWLKGPFGDPQSDSILFLKVLDKDKAAKSLPLGYHFFIQASMGMGHGLSDTGEFKTTNQNEWINDEISFYMPGPYDIKIYLTDENYNELGEATWCSVF